MNTQNLASKMARSLFLSTRRLATLDYLKSKDKEPDPSIMDWLRMLFLRKRAWEYRLEGLIEVVPFLMLFLLFDPEERRRVFQVPASILSATPTEFTSPKGIQRTIFRKQNYNSKYGSVLAFLVFDPIGKLANDFPYHNSSLTYLTHYSDSVSHDTPVNKWLISEFDPRIQWRLLDGNRHGCVQRRYLSEEVARVMNTSHKQKEKK